MLTFDLKMNSLACEFELKIVCKFSSAILIAMVFALDYDLYYFNFSKQRQRDSSNDISADLESN